MRCERFLRNAADPVRFPLPEVFKAVQGRARSILLCKLIVMCPLACLLMLQDSSVRLYFYHFIKLFISLNVISWPAQVVYPLSVAEAVAMEGEGSDAIEAAAILDARLDALMGVVRLQYLVAREGGWGAVAEWGETLSLGAPPLLCRDRGA